MRSSGSSGGSLIIIAIVVVFVVRFFLKSSSHTKSSTQYHSETRSHVVHRDKANIYNSEVNSYKSLQINVQPVKHRTAKQKMPDRELNPAEVFAKSHISYSRLSTFERCPLLFDMIYLRGLKDVSGRPAQLGQLVHKIIALWSEFQIQKNNLILLPDDISKVASFYDEATKQLQLTHCFTLNDVTPYITNFSVLNRTNSLFVQRVERELIRWVNGNKLLTIIDRVDTGIGKHLIIDYKTGNKKYVRRKQLNLYAYAASGSISGDIHLEYQFLKSSERSTWRFTDNMYKDTEAWLLKSVETISNTTKFNKNITRLCDYCSLKTYCA